METDTQEQPAQSTGPDALDLIAAQGEMLEAGVTAPHQEAQERIEQAQQLSTATELRAALEMARMMAAPAFAWWPDFGECWSDKQLSAISEAGAEVMQRHGWTMGEALSKYGPYLALAGATLPPSMATFQAIKARREQAEAEALQRQRMARGQPPGPNQ